VLYFGQFIVRCDRSRAGYLGEATATAHRQVMVNRGGCLGCGTYFGCETYKGRSAKSSEKRKRGLTSMAQPGHKAYYARSRQPCRSDYH